MTYEPGPRRRLVLQLTREGKSPREVALILNLSTERVYQHIRELRRRGLLDEAVAK